MRKKIRLVLLLLCIPLYLHANDTAVDTDRISIEPVPGSYSRDITVSLGGDGDIYYRFQESRDDSFSPYKLPFRLTALPGEEQTYSLQITGGEISRTVRFVIDKKSPPAPVPDAEPGIYNRDLTVTFSASEDSTIYAAADTLPSSPVPEAGITIRQDRLEDRAYTIFTYSRDSAGNTSPLKSYTYVIKKSYTAESFLRVSSPVPGSYTNKQLLVCDCTNFEWIRYSLDGRDPVRNGFEYQAPVLLDRSGSVQLLLAAMPSGGDEIIRKTITYNVITGNALPGFPAQGIFSESITVPGLKGEYRFTLDDTTPEEQDDILREAVRFLPVQGIAKVCILRVLNMEEAEGYGSQYRYVYVIDTRIPEKPAIRVSDSSPVSSSVEVSIEAAQRTDIYYSIDGRTPDNRSTPYRGPFTVDLPENIGFGSIIIKASAYGQNGKKSPESSFLLTFDKKPPETPSVKMEGPLEAGSYTFTADSEYGTRVVYEVSATGLEPRKPTPSSPVLEDTLIFRVPRGMDKAFLIRFSSVDEAGNISAPTDIYSFNIDRIPPDPPGIELTENGLTLEAQNKTFYRIFREDAKKNLPENQTFKVYETTVPLVLSEETGISFRAEAYSEDNAGNRSETVSAVFSKEFAEVRPPSFYGIKKSGLFNSPTVSIRVSPAAVLDVVRYTYTLDGSEPSAPGPDSPEAGSVITFNGTPNAETTVRFKLASFSFDGIVSSEPVSSSFVIDLLDPAVPVLKGFENGGIYNSAVSFHAEPEGEDSIFFSISTEEPIPPDPFGPEGHPMPAVYTLKPDAGTKTVYRIRIGSIDKAGNRSLNETIYSVTIDKELPVLPEPIGIPPSGLTTGNVHVSFPPFQGKIYYTMSSDGTIPAEPDEGSKVYSEHIVLHGEPGKEITFTLRFSCVDNAGNKALYSKVYRCIVDQKAPVTPAKPYINITKNRTGLILGWSEVHSDTIIYRIPETGDTWYAYDSPLSFIIPETQNALTVEYYARDEAGNISTRRTMEISLPFSTSSPLFTGIEDGSIYNNAVILYKSAGTSLCRYEIGVNTDSAPQITPFSQQLPDSITLNASEGETVRYSIRVKLFPSNGVTTVQREQTASFVIDRTPPRPPKIDGIRDDVFYQDDRTISFSSEEGSVRYTVTPIDESRAELEDFNTYSRPFALQTEEGSFSVFEISAYVVDDAGNKSTLKSWFVSIDKEIIYVSENGNDAYDGTRTHPFKTIRKALEHSLETGRRSIYVTGGYYPINSTIELPGNITISGGFNDSEWKREGEAETVFLPGTFFNKKEPLFHILGGRVSLKNIRMYDTSGISSALVSVSGGVCTLSGSSFERTGAGVYTVIQNLGGTLYVNDSKVRLSRCLNSSAFDISGGTAFITDSSIEGSSSNGVISLISMTDGGRLLAGRTSFIPGSGRKTSAFTAKGSSIVLTECNLSTGTGTLSASALQIEDSTLECSASTIYGDPGSRISTNIVAMDSEVSLYNSFLRIDAIEGAAGIRASDSVITVANSSIEGNATEDFMYLFRLDNTFGYFYTNHMTGGETDDFVVTRISGGSLKWYSNSCSFNGGKERSSCFESYRNPFLSIANSIMIQTGVSLDGAFYRANNIRGLECLSNNIFGWGVISITDDGLTADVELFDTRDDNPLGGNLNGNIAEHPSRTFTVSKTEQFKLKLSSACLNNGFDVRPLGGPDRDWDGEARPNPYHGIKPAFDIGADEYYE